MRYIEVVVTAVAKWCCGGVEQAILRDHDSKDARSEQQVREAVAWHGYQYYYYYF